MASTNKTQNLSLNQWVLSDPFLMEDMNEDNRKLDAFAGLMDRKLEFFKLKDITTTVQAEEVSMDISDVHMENYSVIIFCIARIGNGGGKLAFYPCNRQSYYVPGYAPGDNNAHASLGSSGDNNIILLFPMRDGTKNISSLCLGVGDSIITKGRSDKGYYGQTTQLKILPDNTGYYTKEGTRIRIWGVK